MVGKYGTGEQMPREVEDADRILGTLFGSDDAEAGGETRLWNRIQRDLGPQARPWYARLGGISDGSALGFPVRRAALVGLTAAVMIGAVLIVPSLGGESASAQIIEAVDDLSAATSAALSDDALSEAELAGLRKQAEALLVRIQDDPSALADLDLTALSAAITSLQAVEALLVEQQAPASSVVGPVGQATQQVEQALQTRDPSSPLLAATATSDDTVIEAAEGRRSFLAADAGSVVIDIRDGSLILVAARPAAGWTAVPELAAGREINVRFELGDGREVEFEAELEDGLLSTKIDFSEGGSNGGDGSSGSGSSGSGSSGSGSSGSGSSGSGSSGSGSSGGGSSGSGSSGRGSSSGATATPGATSTPSASSTPGATSTPSATSTPGASSGSNGSIPANQDGQLQVGVGQGGSVTLDVTGGLTFVGAAPSSGWTVVRQDVRDDRVEVRFGQGTTQWRLDARLQDDGRITWEVSQHLNEDPAGGSSDDS